MICMIIAGVLIGAPKRFFITSCEHDRIAIMLATILQNTEGNTAAPAAPSAAFGDQSEKHSLAE